MLSRCGLIVLVPDERRREDGTVADFAELCPGETHHFIVLDDALSKPVSQP